MQSSRTTPHEIRQWLPHATICSVIIILIAGVALYGNSFSVPFVFDDFNMLEKTASCKDAHEILLVGGVRWFADLTFAFNRCVGGDAVFGFHLVNLIIHLSASVSLFFLVRCLLEVLLPQTAPDDDVVSGSRQFLQLFVPLGTALLFVCHPVQTQAVTYVVQRYSSLATLFYLLTLLGFVKGRMCGSRMVSFWCWSGALIAALLAFGSKEIAFTLPVALVALDACLFYGKRGQRGMYLALALFLLIMALLYLLRTDGVPGAGFYASLQRTLTEDPHIPRLYYFLTQLRVMVTYLRLLILPVNQNLDYDYPLLVTMMSAPVVLSLLLHLTLIGFSVWLWQRAHRLSLGSLVPVSLGIVWFYLALTVESGIVPISDLIFEHRLYLPSAGIFLAISAAGGTWAAGSIRRERAALLLLGVVCVGLGVATVRRNHVWQDDLRLCQDVAAKSPGKARAVFNLGQAYQRRGMSVRALPLLVHAVELNPGPEMHWTAIGEALEGIAPLAGRFNPGRQYLLKNGMRNLRRVVPAEANSFNNLGVAYEFLGNDAKAKELYMRALAQDSSLDLAWYNMALLALRRNDKAMFHYAADQLRIRNQELAGIVERAARIGTVSP